MKSKPFALLASGGLLALMLALLWAAGAPAHAAPFAVWTVCPAGPPDCDFSVIQDAVDAASEGDAIKIATGSYTGVHARPAPPGYDGPAVITQVVYISKTLTLRGGYTTTNWLTPDPEANPTTLDAQGQGRVLFISGNSTLAVEGLRLVGGDAGELGGGIADLDVGGGLCIFMATADVSHNYVLSSTSFFGGGLAVVDGYATLSNNTISHHTGRVGSGLYAWSSVVTLSNNVISVNSATDWGGGGALDESEVTLTNNTVSFNIGGGLELDQSSGILDSNLILANTTQSEGGGLKIREGNLELTHNQIISNTAEDEGGGLYLHYAPLPNTITLGENVVSGNVASYGGGLFLNYNDATLVQNDISGNTATSGGGLILLGSEAVLANNNISDNHATRHGGGLYLTDFSNATLHANRILNNTADWYGGGLYLEISNPHMANNIIVDNSAGLGAGGLYIEGSSPVLSHSTIARNDSGDGSGVHVRLWGSDYPSVVLLTNTILISHTMGITVEANNTATLEATLWGNDADWAGEGAILTGTVNLWGDPAFVDPDAGDYHLGQSSAATDAGIDAGVSTDIDGDLRPLGLGFDLGADEYAGPVLVLHKSAYPNPVETGSPLTYTLRLTNTGALSLTAALTDVLPAHVAPGGTLTWTPPLLTPGDTWAETVVVTVELGYTGPLTNVVWATTEEGVAGVSTATVVVVDQAIAGLVAANASPTPLGQATALSATVTAGTNVTYTWALGDGDLGSGPVVFHTYPVVGVYMAVVIASNSVSQFTATTSVTITDAPIAGLSAVNDSSTALGSSTTLTATITAGTNVTYTWAFGDGAFGSGPVVTHTYPAANIYTAVVTASNPAGWLTATTRVEVVKPYLYLYLPLVLRATP